MNTVTKENIIDISKQIMRTYGYGGSFGCLDPFYRDGVWITPITIKHRRGLFGDFEYRKMMSTDLGAPGRLEFYDNGKLKYQTPISELLIIESDRLNTIQMQLKNVPNNEKSDFGSENKNIKNIIYKIFSDSCHDGVFCIERDLDWISENDISDVEKFILDLVNLEKKKLIQYCDVCIELGRNVIDCKGYCPDNAMIELANNAKDRDNLVSRILDIINLDYDINCTLWK